MYGKWLHNNVINNVRKHQKHTGSGQLYSQSEYAKLSTNSEIAIFSDLNINPVLCIIGGYFSYRSQ